MSQNRGTSATESARASYLHAKDAAQQVVGQVREQAGEYLEQGKAKVDDMRVRIEEAVRENPMKAILITAGAGLLIGMLLRRH